MCGIFGIVYRDGRTVPNEELLRETGRLLGHRGPDSLGVHRAEGIGLVHTRLSLVDLSSRSDRPFWDENGRFALVYNGEIYNYREIRAELEQRGVAFRTSSDTEVLLNGLVEYGLDALLPRLEGMFAFGLWDAEQRSLTLVRDRFGIKPLSFYEDERLLVFASEIKAIRPWVALEPDPQMASAFLAGFGGSTRIRSFFRDVSILSPGTIRESHFGQRPHERCFRSIGDFWDPDEHDRLTAMGPTQSIDQLEGLLLASVEKHLIADAPVGALCSGGLDSSLIMAMASRSHTNLAIFHADVVGPESESDAARMLAKHLRLDMKSVEVRDEDFCEQLPAALWHYEYPFAYHPNSIPFLRVSRLVRESGVKAILSGEGADECFLGYREIPFEDLRQRYRAAISGLRELVHRIPLLGKEIWPAEVGFGSLVQGMEQNFETVLDREQIEQRIRESGSMVSPRDYRSLGWLGYHLRTLLHRNDALGMAASVEARFPYLDHPVVRRAVNLPHRYKIRPSPTVLDKAHPFLRDKWILRRVADRYLPRSLSRRRKRGFPVNAYERMTVAPELFRRGFVADLYRLSDPALRHLLSASGPAFKVRLLMLEGWGQLFFRDVKEPSLVTAVRSHTAIAPIAN